MSSPKNAILLCGENVMLFTDLLIDKTKRLQPEFDRLFRNILDNQTHEGDLLLIHVNAFYHPDAHKWNNVDKASPYMIGLNDEGHSDLLHYSFIHDYRSKSIAPYSHSEYLQKHEWKEDNEEEINNLTEAESISIQLEMLIYLKIWEADFFIKKLYQITRLSLGEPYDWHFRIAMSNRDKIANTGNRESIIRNKIRDKLKANYPAIYLAINESYKTQIRNAIAHSSYYFGGRHIQLGNYIEEDRNSQIQVISFNEWTDIFHNTMIIYNQLTRFLSEIDKLYSSIAMKNDLIFPIRVNRLFPEEKTEYRQLQYRSEISDWVFYRNEYKIK